MLKIKKESLDEILTCKICLKYFSEPITLPCGNNICKKHIDQRVSHYVFKCLICNKYHTVNEDGFGVSVAIQLILEEFKNGSFCDVNKYLIHPFESNIIATKSQAMDLLMLCGFALKRKFTLIYRASRDGFGAEQFHAKCDNIHKTLTIIKARDSPHIFGGYTRCKWNHSGRYGNFKTDSNAFLFSLVNSDNQPVRIKITRKDQESAVFSNSRYLVTFGTGHDLRIATNSNTSNASYSNMGMTYAHPKYSYGTIEAVNFLAGSYNFCTSEIEVFKVE